MSARDELAELAREQILGPDSGNMLTYEIADAILAAGYVKTPTPEYHYGERFLETGYTYHTSVSEDEARRFVEGMNEVGAKMEVVRRSYIPPTYGEWESVSD